MKNSILFFCFFLFSFGMFAQVVRQKSLSTSSSNLPPNKEVFQPAPKSLPNRGTQQPNKWGGELSTSAVPSITGTYKQLIKSADNKSIEVLYKINEGTASVMKNNSGTVNQRSSKKLVKNQQQGGDDNWNCSTENIRVNINDDSYMRVCVQAQAVNVYPGFIYKFDNYINGQWRNETGGRNPIVISASVENMNGSPQETIVDPDLPNTRNAIVNLFGRFSRKAEEVAAGGLKVHVEEIFSSSDLDIKIGASGYGGGFSASNQFQLQKKSNNRIFLFDCTKEMFTLDAIQPAQGFFTEPARATNDMMYISSVTYGLRILALVQFEVNEESINNNFKGSYDALTAGGMASIDVAKNIVNNKATINLFVVGGQSNTVYSEYTIDAMKTRLQDIQRTLTYNNSKPISYQFRNLQNDLVRYSSATDWFPVSSCEPKSENEKSSSFLTKIEFIRLDDPANDDVDLYGTIRAELVDGAGNKVAAEHGNTYLLNLKSNEYIRKEELKKSASLPVNDISFFVNAGNVPGSRLLIHYWLMDEDASSDDPIKMRGKDPDYLVNGNKHYVQTIYLDELKKGSNIQKNAGFVDEDGDYPFTITIYVEKK